MITINWRDENSPVNNNSMGAETEAGLHNGTDDGISSTENGHDQGC